MKPLRVLLVEDSEDDAQLVLYQLEKHGYGVTCERVDSAGPFNSALDKQNWDIVISDYIIPGFSGLEVLDNLKRKRPDLPCIIISGRIDEEIAVAAMKSGAKDYVMKDNLKRLGPAIERELLEAHTRQEARKTVEETSRKLASLVESSNDAIISTSPTGTITTWNKGAEKIYVYPENEVVGRHITILAGPSGEEEVQLLLDKILRGERVIAYGTTHKTKSGNVMDVSLTGSPLRNSNGEITGTSIIARDITANKILERRIVLSNEVMRLFWNASTKDEYLEKAVDLIHKWCKCDCIGIRIVRTEDRTIPYLASRGFTPEFMETECFLSLERDNCACIRAILGQMEPQDRPVVTPSGSFYLEHSFDFVENLTEEQQQRFRGMCVRTGYQTIIIVPIRHRQTVLGAIHIADKQASALSLKEVETLESISEIIGQGIYRWDIEDELRTGQKKLRQSEEELHALSRRLVETQEIERRTIARELHDEIGQSLTALRMLLFQVARHCDQNSMEHLEEAKNVIGGLMKQVREMSLKLRPSMLDDLGLVPTLVWYFERFQNQTGIQIVFNHDGLYTIQSSLTQELNTAVYRIVQEALTNIARYANVTTARVTMRVEEDILQVSIQDEGDGFSPDRLNAVTSAGLSSMKERVRLLDGKLTIDSAPGKGTHIMAELSVRSVSRRLV